MEKRADSSEAVTQEPLPFVGLKAQAERLRPRIEERLGAVLDHGAFINGPEIEELEQALSQRAGSADCVACSSGTDALVMVLLERGIGPGDVVFVPTFTFTATAEVVLLVGATPCFVDVRAQTMNLDPEDLTRQYETVLEQGRGTPRAVIAVDLFGLPAEYETLSKFCAERELDLIADAAQSFGGALEGQPVGALAPMTTTSFFPAKPFGGYGDGGAIFVRSDDATTAGDEGYGDRLRSIREHGKGPDRYDIVRIGLNARLDTFQAAVLLVKLEVFDEEIERREQLALAYDEGLRGSGLTLPPRDPRAQSAWAQYTVQTDDRDGVRSRLQQQGIPTGVYYPLPMHLQPAYATSAQPAGSLPVSEELARRVFSLPMHPYQSATDTERVVAAVRAALC